MSFVFALPHRSKRSRQSVFVFLNQIFSWHLRQTMKKMIHGLIKRRRSFGRFPKRLSETKMRRHSGRFWKFYLIRKMARLAKREREREDGKVWQFFNSTQRTIHRILLWRGSPMLRTIKPPQLSFWVAEKHLNSIKMISAKNQGQKTFHIEGVSLFPFLSLPRVLQAR